MKETKKNIKKIAQRVSDSNFRGRFFLVSPPRLISHFHHGSKDTVVFFAHSQNLQLRRYMFFTLPLRGNFSSIHFGRIHRSVWNVHIVVDIVPFSYRAHTSRLNENNFVATSSTHQSYARIVRFDWNLLLWTDVCVEAVEL